MKVTVLVVGPNPLPSAIPVGIVVAHRQYAIADHRPAGVAVDALQHQHALTHFCQSVRRPARPRHDARRREDGGGVGDIHRHPAHDGHPVIRYVRVTAGIPQCGSVENQVRGTAGRRADGAGHSADEQRVGLQLQNAPANHRRPGVAVRVQDRQGAAIGLGQTGAPGNAAAAGEGVMFRRELLTSTEVGATVSLMFKGGFVEP